MSQHIHSAHRRCIASLAIHWIDNIVFLTCCENKPSPAYHFIDIYMSLSVNTGLFKCDVSNILAWGLSSCSRKFVFMFSHRFSNYKGYRLSLWRTKFVFGELYVFQMLLPTYCPSVNIFKHPGWLWSLETVLALLPHEVAFVNRYRKYHYWDE